MTAAHHASTTLGDVVAIPVPLLGPYGVILESDELGKCALIKAWERLPDGKIGPIQKHGGVRIGDVLIALNETQLHDTRFDDVMRLVRSDNLLKKTLYFAPKEELARRRGHRVSLSAGPGGVGAGAKGSAFMSQIRRARVNESGKSAFVDYEVACCLRTASTQPQKENSHKWSVWKRYSEFEALDQSLRHFVGWQLASIAFAPKHTLVFNKLALPFIDMRRRELDEWWQKILAIDRITDFTKHHCSQDLKDFLEVSVWLNGGAEAKEEGVEGGGGSVKPTVRRQSSGTRTRSLRAARDSSPLYRSNSGSAVTTNGSGSLIEDQQRAAASSVASAPAVAEGTRASASHSSAPRPPPPTMSVVVTAPPTKARSSMTTSGQPSAPSVTGTSIRPTTAARTNLLADIRRRKKE